MSYIAMEFIDGVGLDRVIATAGRAPIERAASLAAQVADALDFAHRNNVVHRDIKPANIMIEAGDRVKVTDFGIAKVTDSGDHLTVTGSLLGTPSYMSPEQARGAALDGRSDLFAVGAVLYEMLAGKKAFRGDSITGLIFKIITEEPPPIRELDPSLPDEIVRILARSLAKAPEMRYQTGREMADDLARPDAARVDADAAPGRGGDGTGAEGLQRAADHQRDPDPARGDRDRASGRAGHRGDTGGRSRASAPFASSTASRGRRLTRLLPPVAAPPRSNTGLLVGIAAGALVLLVGVGAAGWYVLGHRGPQPPATGSISGTAGATAGVPASTTPPTSVAAAPVETQPAAPPEAEAAPPVGVPAVRSGAAAPPPRSTGGAAPAGEAAPPAGTVAEPPARTADARYRYLDEEAAEGSGREAGDRASDAYRGRQQGWSRGNPGSFGTNRRFAQRERSPRDLGPGERPAVATLRHVMDREEVYKKATGRYGTLAEMARASGFGLDVPFAATQFQRKGYRFDLTIEEDGFKVTAVPAGPGSRSFVGDDSGYIRSGLE
jgi:hypothetical protein